VLVLGRRGRRDVVSFDLLCWFVGDWGRDVRPAAVSLSFASPKESKQRKGDPAVSVPPLRYGQPAVLVPSGVRANSLRSNMRSPDPLGPALLGAHRRAGGGCDGPLLRSAGITAIWRIPVQVDVQVQVPAAAAARFLSSSHAPAMAHRDAEGEPGPKPLCVRRAAQHNEDQRAACLSRRRVCGQPSFCEQRRLPRERSGRGRTQWGRLFFAYFLLAKQKKVRPPPGGHPGQHPQPNNTHKTDPRS